MVLIISNPTFSGPVAKHMAELRLRSEEDRLRIERLELERMRADIEQGDVSRNTGSTNKKTG